jgi:hypothetical protein
MRRPNDRIKFTEIGFPGAAQARLLAALLVDKRQVALQFHTVVQDAPDLDDPSRGYPVQEKVTSATTMSRNVQSAEAPHDLVSGLGSSDIGTVGKRADRLNKRVAIAAGLPGAEILSRPFENICEIELCRSTEANAPFRLGHDALLGCAGNDFFGKVIQIGLQVLDIFELLEFAPIQRGGADARCLP